MRMKVSQEGRTLVDYVHQEDEQGESDHFI